MLGEIFFKALWDLIESISSSMDNGPTISPSKTSDNNGNNENEMSEIEFFDIIAFTFWSLFTSFWFLFINVSMSHLERISDFSNELWNEKFSW